MLPHTNSTMASISFPSSIRSSNNIIKLSFFPSFLSPSSSHSKPFFTSSPLSFSSFKSITFQRLSSPSPPPPPPPPPPPSTPPQTSTLPPKLQEIITLFQSTPDPRSKYQQLLFYANNLPPLSPTYKIQANKVQGCVSQVWVRAFLEDNLVFFQADSDSVMTKGLAALLVLSLSGLPVRDIVQVSPDFITLLGLQHNLTPSRNNGFFNMFKLMQHKALLLGLESEKNPYDGNGVIESSSSLGSVDEVVGENVSESLSLEVGSGENGEIGVIESSSNLGSVDEVVGEIGSQSLNLEVGSSQNGEIGVIESSSSLGSVDEVGGDDVSESLNLEVGSSQNDGNGVIESSSKEGSRGERIREKLGRELNPIEIEVEDISYQHAGHAGVRGSDGETHFNLKIVSDEFEEKSLVKRHRMIYGLLQDELESGLHALSIVAKTPTEVQEGK